MTKVFDIVSIPSEGSISMQSLKYCLTKTAWNILSDMEGVFFKGYSVTDKHMSPLDDYVIVLVSSDGVVLSSYCHYSCGYTKWHTLKDIGNKFLKRGKKASDFKVLFMTRRDLDKADVVYQNGMIKQHFCI